MKAKAVIVEELEKALPKSELPFVVFYWKSEGKRCRPLVYRGGYKTATSDNTTDPRSTDTTSTHFIVLAFGGVVIYAIEIIVYDAPGSQQTIFVSKADTTGHYNLNSSMEEIKNRPRLPYAKVTSAILRGLIRCFIDPLRPVRLCLFARAEKQYLFPLSSECSTKHILSGSQLLRWWIKVFTDTLQGSERLLLSIERARLQIPGNDPTIIKHFFPRAGSDTSSSGPSIEWQVGDIFWPDDDPNLPAVKCVPRFSDDPLTRFLDYLVTEKRALTTGQNRFWIELQARQEFRLSVEVGVLGVEFKVDPSQSEYQYLKDTKDTSIASLSPRKLNQLREFLITLDYSILEMNQEAMETLTRRNPTIEVFGKIEESPEGEKAKSGLEVNVLNMGLITRKKLKVVAEPVTILNTMVVRKKPKK